AAEHVERLARQLARDVQDTIEFVEEQWTALAEDPNPDDPEIAQDYARFREAHRMLTQEIAEIDRVQERIAAEERRVAEQLRPIVDGRICLVGYTATAVADMVTTPHIARMPGVLV